MIETKNSGEKMTLQEKLDIALAYLKNLDLAGLEPEQVKKCVGKVRI